MKKSKLRLYVQFIALLSSVLLVTVAKVQPVIANVYPNGTNMFQPSPTLTFTASSPAGVTNVTVEVPVFIACTCNRGVCENLQQSRGWLLEPFLRGATTT